MIPTQKTRLMHIPISQEICDLCKKRVSVPRLNDNVGALVEKHKLIEVNVSRIPHYLDPCVLITGEGSAAIAMAVEVLR